MLSRSVVQLLKETKFNNSLCWRQEGRDSHQVGRKVQAANCTDMQIPSCSFTVSENWYIGSNSIMRQPGSIIAFDGSMINRISYLRNELRLRGIYICLIT